VVKTKPIEINLFGACVVRSAKPGGFQITGAKHKALFALLATAPFGRRTRSFLQDTLWGTACYDTGRQSLRRALSDLRKIMGDAFPDILSSTNSDLTLNLAKVSFMGRPGSGEFLEGLDLKEEGFSAWLRAMRHDPQQIYSLYSSSSQAPAAPMLPMIAVLPFQAVSRAPHDGILGDWLAEEVCRSLSRSNMLAVISHLSSRALGGRVVDTPTIRERLAVDYCVAGTLRFGRSEIVLDADFIDTASGRILWTRQFAGPVDTFLERSAEGIAQIVRAVGGTIADEAIRHVAGRPLSDLEDHRLLVAGIGLMHRPALRDFAKSRELLEEALRRAPRAAEAHAWFGKWHLLSVINGWSTDPARDTGIAMDSTARALDIAPDNALCLTIDGFGHNNLLRRMDTAALRYKEALRSNPNESLAWLLTSALHAFRDDGDMAVTAAEKARGLSPIDPFQYLYESLSATAFLAAERYEDALSLAERSLLRHRSHSSTLRAKIVALHYLGRRDESRRAAVRLLNVQPNFTVESYLRDHPAADFDIGRRAAVALAEAGIP
jgi:TolB-like protein